MVGEVPCSDRKKLVDVALSRVQQNAVIVNGTLVDVATRRLLPDTFVAISGERIALVGKGRPETGPGTTLIDAEGAYIVPGLVDAHYHIESSRLTPHRHAQITLPHGTTTIFEGVTRSVTLSA